VAGNPRVWIHLIMALRFRPTNSPAWGGLSNSLMHYNYRASEKDEESVFGESVHNAIPCILHHINSSVAPERDQRQRTSLGED
jgi:hypothetical protein